VEVGAAYLVEEFASHCLIKNLFSFSFENCEKKSEKVANFTRDPTKTSGAFSKQLKTSDSLTERRI